MFQKWRGNFQQKSKQLNIHTLIQSLISIRNPNISKLKCVPSQYMNDNFLLRQNNGTMKISTIISNRVNISIATKYDKHLQENPYTFSTIHRLNYLTFYGVIISSDHNPPIANNETIEQPNLFVRTIQSKLTNTKMNTNLTSYEKRMTWLLNNCSTHVTCQSNP